MAKARSFAAMNSPLQGLTWQSGDSRRFVSVFKQFRSRWPIHLMCLVGEAQKPLEKTYQNFLVRYFSKVEKLIR